MAKNYKRDKVIAQLKRNGFKPVYAKKSKRLLYFKAPKSRIVGIKNWGYLDFLGVSVR
ncbi:MAG: hypothetical protein PVG65_00180 [Candidatus Thorarchaeota archaeon]|jgi:hypothetical protein